MTDLLSYLNVCLDNRHIERCPRSESVLPDRGGNQFVATGANRNQIILY
ncbi:MAG: hypothetical protein WC565_10805 [Parcubacteria group bacterium]